MRHKINPHAFLFALIITALFGLTRCCDESVKPKMPVITKQSDLVFFTYQEVIDYMSLKKTRIVSAGVIVGSEYYIFVFADQQKCYVTKETYERIF